jgi:hypothetical protein
MSKPAPSAREAAIEELQARLSRITRGNGFNTDAGSQICLMERPVFGPDDPPAAISIIIPEDSPNPSQREHVITLVQFTVQAIVPAAVEWQSWVPWREIERIIADIKRAVELPDRTLGGALITDGLTRGSTRALEREPGSEVVGGAVDYRGVFGEVWGAP